MGYKKVNENSLTAIANAIRSKAGTANSMTFPQGFIDTISSIAAGGSLQDIPTALEASGADIVEGKKAYNDQGTLITGSIPDQFFYRGDIGLLDDDDTEATYIDGNGGYQQEGTCYQYTFPSGYYRYSHGNSILGVHESVTLDQFPKTFMAPLQGEEGSFPRNLYEAITVDSLGGDIYRVKTGYFYVATGASYLISAIPFQPLGCVFFQYDRASSQGRGVVVGYGKLLQSGAYFGPDENNQNRAFGGSRGATGSESAASVFSTFFNYSGKSDDDFISVSGSGNNYSLTIDVGVNGRYIRGYNGYVIWGR